MARVARSATAGTSPTTTPVGMAATPTATAPAAPPRPGSVAELLAAVPPRNANEPLDAYTSRLDGTGRQSLIVANAHRLAVGMALLDDPLRPKKKTPNPSTGLNRTQWEDQEAQRLNLQARQLRNILAAAEAVRRISADRLPKEVLDRRIDCVARAAKAAAEIAKANGGAFPAGTPLPGDFQAVAQKAALDPVARWVARLDALTKAQRKLKQAIKDDGTGVIRREVERLRESLLFVVQRPTPPGHAPAKPNLQNGLVGYPGGKVALLQHLLHAFGNVADGEYREPFIGGGSVALTVLATYPAARVYINDRYAPLAALWKQVQDDPDTLIQWITARPTVSDAELRQHRANLIAGHVGGVPLTGIDLAGTALICIVLSHRATGIRGGAKTGKHLQDRWKPDTLEKAITRVHGLIGPPQPGVRSRAEIENLDFRTVINRPGKAFIYCDPPYVWQGPRLYPVPFTRDDHLRLAETLLATTNPWVLSYDDWLHPIPPETKPSKGAQKQAALAQPQHPSLPSAGPPVNKRQDAEALRKELHDIYGKADCVIRRIRFRPGNRYKGGRNDSHEMLICPKSHAYLLSPYPPDTVTTVNGDLSMFETPDNYITDLIEAARNP